MRDNIIVVPELAVRVVLSSVRLINRNSSGPVK